MSVRTTCPYCGVGCGVLASFAGGAIAVGGDPHHPANLGRLCSKGLALGETVGIEDRLLHPEIRGVRASWSEALDHVSGELARIVREHGPDAVALYASGQLLTEDYYVANKLMKGFIGSANIDTNSRLCMSSAVAGHQRAFGEDLVPGCYEDLELAELIVLVGSNAAWCHPVLFQRIAQAKERCSQGADGRPPIKVVVIDPRRTPSCDIADLHLPVRPGTDVWLFNGLLGYLRRHGLADAAFVAAHTEGAREALEAAEASAPNEESVARACGVDTSRIGEFYQMFAAAGKVITAFSQGVNQSSSGTDKVNSIINCHLLTGRIGRPGMGPLSLTGQPNAMGGREVGGMASMLAAHMDLESEAHRRIVQDFWASPRLAARPGLKAVELFDSVHCGRIKALWIMATNPLVSLPDADRAREALARCQLVVVSDCMADTDTIRAAHVRLPAAAWGEKDGTVTNSERGISRQRAFLPAPGEAKPDWWIVSEVAKRMGFARGFDYTSPHEIFDEHARLSGAGNAGTRIFDIGGLAGLTREQYDELEPVQWPVARQGCGGTRRLFEDRRFAYPDGRARFVPTPPRAPVHAVGGDQPLALNTGRIRDQWHTMTRTGRAPRLVEHLPEPFIDVHGQDALLAGVRANELARITTRWGSMIARVRTSGEIARGQAFVPIHWSAANASEARAGALVSPAVDPLSGQPEFKHTPARIEPFVVDWFGLLGTRRPLELHRETRWPGRPAQPQRPEWRDVAWWVLARGDGFLRYELAGRGVPLDWAERGREWLGAALPDEDYLDYHDEASGIYRAARVVDDRLDSCVYVSRRPELPDRGWLAGLFSKPALEAADRVALLAGRPIEAPADGGIGSVDAGPLVCSCFFVRRSTICEAIRTHRLTSPKDVGARLGAGTNCGSCVPEIRALIAMTMEAPT
jgi:assimilatory nitrate reductase catalytic subunit